MIARRLLLALFAVAFIGGLFLAACASSSPADSRTPDSPGLPTPLVTIDPAELVLQERCSECHSLQRVVSARKTQAEWERSVRRMVNLGARLSDAEFAALVDYLAATYK